MITSEAGRKKIEAFEGCVLHAYPDGKYYSIGYGHNGPDVKADMTITKERADELFAADLARFEKAVNDLGMLLSQNQFDALVDFAYNCGSGALSQVCKTKDITEICKRIPEWCKDGYGHVLPALKKRRAWEVSQLEQPVKTGTVTADVLNIREGAGTFNIIVGAYRGGETVSIYETWHRTDDGWVCADYVDIK